MTDPPGRRATLLALLTDHVLAHGFESASLRPLARAAGTSDRMLLYYFTDKADLVGAILGEIAARLSAMLSEEPADLLPPEALRRRITARLLAPDLWPAMRVWLEVASRAAAGDSLFKMHGEAIARGFLAWGAAQLDVPEQERDGEAARLMMAVEGAVLLNALGLGDAVVATLDRA